MTLYSSREPFNDDPTPWVSSVTGSRYSTPAKYGHTQWSFEPRPEYDRPQHNPTNQLLKAARRAQADGFLSDFLEGFLSERNTEHSEIDHAQRVLTRLAALKEDA